MYHAKLIFSATVAMGAFAGIAPALAADLPSYTKAPPIFIDPGYNWSGFYAGLNAGYSSASIYNTVTNGTGNATGVPALRPPALGFYDRGFTGGGQAGYNYQFDMGTAKLVVGAEADIEYTGLNNSSSVTLGSGPSIFQTRLQYLNTIRGRAGLAFDRFLVFGTGGFAGGKVNTTTNFFNAAAVNDYSGSLNSYRTGYTYGGGIEYAPLWADYPVTLRIEYLGYNLGTKYIPVPVTPAGLVAGATGQYSSTTRVRGDLFRFGLNYKFSSSSPVVAKY